MNIDPERDNCPCGSGKLIKMCCLVDGRLVPRSIQLIRPNGPAMLAKCYASELAGCSDNISLEHYMSRAVLERLQVVGGVLRVDGLRGRVAQRDSSIPIGRIGAKILCSKHNSALSPLDLVGARFFESLSRAVEHAGQTGASGPDRVTLLSGFDFERWLLKVLIGATASVLPEGARDWRPPSRWLAILFDGTPFMEDEGLWFVGEVGDAFPVADSVSFGAISKEATGEVVGLTIHLRGFAFALSLRPGLIRRGLHRPGEICFGPSGGIERLIKLGWTIPYGERAVHVTLGATAPKSS